MFESPRLRLRTILDDDFKEFHRWWSDPEVMTLQTKLPIRLDWEATNRRMFEKWREEGPTGVGFSITLKTSGELIGACSMWGINDRNRSAELAIIIGPKEWWGEGLGPEALRLVLQYGFGELNLHRVFLKVNAFNERAVKAYKKAGFVVEGRLRETFFRAGKWHDELVMSVLQHEYLREPELEVGEAG